MAVIELKNKVRKRIESLNDEHLLEEILNLIDFESDKEEIYSIPLDHQKVLEISLEQMKNGNTISNEDVNDKVQKWLSK
jgi:superfamily I DNA and RNA helicase